MKPYEFYQRRIYKDYDLDPKEVRKWSFYNGKDSEYGVDLRELNKPNSNAPTYKETFNTQRNSPTNLIRRLEKNNPEFYDLYRFISAQNKEIHHKYHNYQNNDNYEDIKGFCYSATIDEIKNNDYVLTPGRYVGVEDNNEDSIPFEEKMKSITSELSKQFEESHKLEEEIKKNLNAIGYDI